jgi:hypothetical protein
VRSQLRMMSTLSGASVTDAEWPLPHSRPFPPLQIGISARLHPFRFARHLGGADPFERCAGQEKRRSDGDVMQGVIGRILARFLMRGDGHATTATTTPHPDIAPPPGWIAPNGWSLRPHPVEG